MSKNFWILLQGQFVSTFGSSLFYIMFILYGQKNFDSASKLAFLIMLAQLPGVIIGPFTSGLIDKLSKKKLLIFLDFASGLSMLILAYGFHGLSNNYISYLMFAVVIALGIINSLLKPTVFALSIESIAEKKYKKANSYLQASFEIANIVAQGIGGILFIWLGPLYLTLINALSYFFSGFSEFLITDKSPKQNKNISFKSVLNDSIEGFKYIHSNSGFKNFISVSMLVNISVAPMAILLPFHIKESLALPGSYFGYCLSAQAIGMILGYTLVSKIKIKKLSLFLNLLFTSLSISIAFQGFAKNEYFLVISSALIGISVAMINAPLMEIIQKIPPKELKGRVLGTFINLIGLIAPLSIGLMGLILEFIDIQTQTLFLILALILTVCNILIYSMKSIHQLINK